MKSRAQSMSGWLGLAAMIGLAAILIVASVVMIQEIWLMGAVTARGVQADMVDSVVESLDERSGSVDPLAVAYIRTQVELCSKNNARTYKMDYSRLVGWHGLGEADSDKWSEAVDQLLRECVKEFVIGSASVQDARDRNGLLDVMGLSPFPDEALAAMSFGG